MKKHRPTRIRIKPLRYWKNERIHYDIKGDISSVELLESSATYHFKHFDTDIIKIHNDNSNLYKKQAASARSCRYNTQMHAMNQTKKGKNEIEEKLNSFNGKDDRIEVIDLTSSRKIQPSPAKKSPNLNEIKEKSKLHAPETLKHNEENTKLPAPEPFQHNEENSRLPAPKPLKHKEENSKLPAPEPLKHHKKKRLPAPEPLQHNERNLGLSAIEPLKNNEKNSKVPAPEPFEHHEENSRLLALEPLKHKEKSQLSVPEALKHNEENIQDVSKSKRHIQDIIDLVISNQLGKDDRIEVIDLTSSRKIQPSPAKKSPNLNEIKEKSKLHAPETLKHNEENTKLPAAEPFQHNEENSTLPTPEPLKHHEEKRLPAPEPLQHNERNLGLSALEPLKNNEENSKVPAPEPFEHHEENSRLLALEPLKHKEKSQLSVPEALKHNEENIQDVSKSKRHIQDISDLVISNQLDRTLLNCSTHPKQLCNSHDNRQYPVDISLIKTGLQDQCIFNLDAMDKVVNSLEEAYFVEKGPYDSNLGLITGFIGLKSDTLHWGQITFPREIFVIQGAGELRLIPSDAETAASTPILEGNTYKVFPKGQLMVRKDESCPLLMLFVTFIIDQRITDDNDA